MSQKFAKSQSSHPDTYDKTFNGSIITGCGKGRNVIDQFTEIKVLLHPDSNKETYESSRPVTPSGSGVYFL